MYIKENGKSFYRNEIASVDLTNLINIKQKVSIIFYSNVTGTSEICF